jgi:hypothetical protein
MDFYRFGSKTAVLSVDSSRSNINNNSNSSNRVVRKQPHRVPLSPKTNLQRHNLPPPRKPLYPQSTVYLPAHHHPRLLPCLLYLQEIHLIWNHRHWHPRQGRRARAQEAEPYLQQEVRPHRPRQHPTQAVLPFGVLRPPSLVTGSYQVREIMGVARWKFLIGKVLEIFRKIYNRFSIFLLNGKFPETFWKFSWNFPWKFVPGKNRKQR